MSKHPVLIVKKPGFCRYTSIVFLLIFSLHGSLAQDSIPGIERSEDKVMIEGEIYYIHIVEKGQTLFSLSQTYNVPQKEIVKENPNVMLGLQTGMALKIPYSPPEKKERAREEGVKDEDYIFHEVKKGQTLFSLSKKYGLSIEKIYQHNPRVEEEGLKSGQLIRIPRGAQLEEGPIAKEDGFIYHEVRKKETLYSLSKKYNVPMEEIEGANPSIQKEGLKFGQTIKIPRPERQKEEFLFTQEPVSPLTDTMGFIQDSLLYMKPMEYERSRPNHYKKPKTFKIALFLPFYLEENKRFNQPDTTRKVMGQDTLLEINEKNEFRIFPKSLKFIEFYEGMLLALDSLKKQGASFELHVFSTEENPAKLQEILDKPVMKKMDMIIGPAYQKCFKIVSAFAKKEQVYLVSPFPSPRDIILDNPYVFKVQPSIEQKYYKIAAYLSHEPENNIILIYDDNLKDSLRTLQFKKTLFNIFKEKDILNETVVKEVLPTDSLERTLEHSLSLDKKNMVFVNSTKEPFVSDIISKLNTFNHRDYDISVVGYPVWQYYRNIDINFLYDLQVQFITPFHVDYENPAVTTFLKKYRRHYFTEPSPFSYSFLGYDVMSYFGTALHLFDIEFPYHLSSINPGTVYSNFSFYRLGNQGGFENLDGHMYQYRSGFRIMKTLESLPLLEKVGLIYP